MRGNEIRQKFLDFFASKGHQIVDSSSLVPHGDPTLLFTNAGMVQFKDVFLGLDKRPYRRAATAQKCVRAGGKHNDLDQVGRTARHHTFFEMMGNFSFGDYFKSETIKYAWEFLTRELGLPVEQLWATVYQDDDEALELWVALTPLERSRVIKLGAEDNFWAMGDTGPCGPCSEIIFDRGEQYRCQAPECGIGKCDCDRWLELWNLVFMQFERDNDGNMAPLPRPSIDTGLGLERIASVLQGVDSNFDTDLLRPLIDAASQLAGQPYYGDERGFGLRVIADHARSCTFLIADGVLPSNEGRGYVLRRILRRAVRFGQSLGIAGPFLHKLVPVVADLMGEAYPQLNSDLKHIEQVIRAEEERFRQTLSDGLRMADEIIARTKAAGIKVIKGSDAFLLYDTYGFPLDLTEDVAESHGLQVDRDGFDDAMQQQRARARAARAGSADRVSLIAAAVADFEPTLFCGYEDLAQEAVVRAIVVDGELVESLSGQGWLVLDCTPFYAESGGQVADTGWLETSQGRCQVTDVQRLPNGVIVHLVHGEGTLANGSRVQAIVDAPRRWAIARNHTATHLVHQALQRVLGTHAEQRGSLVAPDRLRFDFSHFQAVTNEELTRVEALVNEAILADLAVQVYETSHAEARRDGVVALFGEKYGERVRVVAVDGFSKELCGGTHVRHTSQIGLFKIISQGSIGAGLRRLEAVTAMGVLQELQTAQACCQEAAQVLRCQPGELVAKASELVEKLRQTENELQTYRDRMASAEVSDLVAKMQQVGGVPVIAGQVSAVDQQGLRRMLDKLRDEVSSAVIVLGAPNGEKVNLVAAVTEDLVKKGLHAGRLVGAVARLVGGGGGGRPDMAQAGGRLPGELSKALQAVAGLVQEELERA
ncbi:MAG: alanine--tRNA ligase [Bacillota bacterium]|jgi:alanyl-tRNA synthetase